jgi:DNA-binding XRE family transcriptional regulator
MLAMARLDKEHSEVMETEGNKVRERRTALGMSQEELAKEAKARGHGVNRDTVGAIEKGLGYRAASLTKINKTLDELEEEAGMHAPPLPQTDTIEFQVSGDFGVKVVVSGPIKDADTLRRQASLLIQDMRSRPSGDQNDT